MKCRSCKTELLHTFVDLNAAPPSNAYLRSTDLDKVEPYFPLKVYTCTECWLVQTQDHASAEELFSKDYAYFSSTSSTWLSHAAEFSKNIISRLHLTSESKVIEIACNDGYLLKNFVAAKIPCLGIEPTASTAAEAERKGIPVRREFFGLDSAKRLAATGELADLIIGNNVYAHVPDILDFTAGLKTVLKGAGVITLEFPHLLHLITGKQFDTIYHEHFSYLSLQAVDRILRRYDLRIFDIEELTTHGGSLRLYICHSTSDWKESSHVAVIRKREIDAGLCRLETYTTFQGETERIKDQFLQFLLEKKQAGKLVAAYGAAAKGNTLLNYAGVHRDLIQFVVDAAPAKQGKFLPGSRIPILSPSALKERRPEVVIIFPWNIANEIVSDHSYIKQWGGTFVRVVPSLGSIL